jgi:hypothetical protein
MNFFSRRRRTLELHPAPGISLRLPSGVSEAAGFHHLGIWRKTACFATLNSTIMGYPSLFADFPPITFKWTEKSGPAEASTTIYCEHGWMPRSTYQISAAGCNQRHPVARLLTDPEAPLVEPTPANLQRLEQAKRTFAPASAPLELCHKPFFLFPLQTINDLNFERCGLDFAALAKEPSAPRLLVQRLSTLIAEAAPGVRVIFFQHPAEKNSPCAAALQLQAGHEYVSNDRKLRSLDLLLSPSCRGMISINSNALNEAALFAKPIYQLGDFLMPRFPNRFHPYTLAEFLEAPERCHAAGDTTRYLLTLMHHQHSLADLADPHSLRELILKEIAQQPLSA